MTLETVPTESLRAVIRACEGGRVLSQEFLLAHNFPPRVVAILVANHEGGEIGGVSVEPTSKRYSSGKLQPSARAAETPGAYDFDVLVMVAGALNVPVSFLHDHQAQNAAAIRASLEAALDDRDS